MRRPHWELQLVEAIEAAAERPFSWGEHDCVTWAADVQAMLTGNASFADQWRGRYTTALGAQRHMRRLGYDSIRAAVAGFLGEPLASPKLAQRGDVVLAPVLLTESADGSLGICVGGKAAFVGMTGLQFAPLRACEAAWRV